MRKSKFEIFLKIGFFAVLSLVAFILLLPSSKKKSVEEKANYAGSKSCLECHQQEFDQWKNSHHGLAERELLPSEKKQIIADHTSERVIGHDPLRQFLVKFPNGRYQASEKAYDPNRHEWFNIFGKENRRPGEWGHWTGRGMNWNSNCASCHNTNVQKNYDEKTDSYNTTMAEMAVSCESCHGPLNEHALWQKTTKGDDPTLRKFSKDQIIETCATCHSRRQDLTGTFRPGDSFHDHYKLTIVDATDTFYPDGQIKGENYEYSSFLGSKMYEKGVRCIDCHTPHTAKLRLPGNLMCLKCHDGSEPNAPVINPNQHSFHKVDDYRDLSKIENRDKKKIAKMGGECINCHMPQTVYMQRHPRHDHGFTTPDPLLTKTHGIPNACNRCHQDKSADWAIKWTDKWYGKKMERASRLRAQTIANVRKGEASSILKLMEMVKGDESPYWKAAAIELLAPYIQDPSVSEILKSALSNTSPLIREKASGLVDLNLNDPVRSVRFNLAWLKRTTIDLNSPEGKELKEIIDFNADQPTGRMQKGSLYLSQGNPLEALKHYEKALEWDPYSAPLHHDIAIILAGINQIDKATNHLKKAIDLDPKDADYRLKLGLALNELGKTKEAIESFKMAVKLDPNFANAWYNLGLSLNSIGEKHKAKEALIKGQKADPNDLRIQNAINSLKGK
jgi:tetratricopeptide (TPR) repeat protein